MLDIAVDAIRATARLPGPLAAALVDVRPLGKEDSCPGATSLQTDKPTTRQTADADGHKTGDGQEVAFKQERVKI